MDIVIFIFTFLAGIISDRFYSFCHRGYDKSKAIKKAPELFTLLTATNSCYDKKKDAVSYKMIKSVDVDSLGKRQMTCTFQKIDTSKSVSLSNNPRIVRIRIRNNSISGIHIKSFSYKDYDDYNTFNWDGKIIDIDEDLTLFFEIGDCPSAINIAYDGYDFTYLASLTNCFSKPSSAKRIKTKK